jgi:tRNA G18 (ribose-2'-O)-methylase SpoU
LTQAVGQELLNKHEVIKVSDQVMNAMADVENPQGILALATTNSIDIQELEQQMPAGLMQLFFRMKV